MMMTRSAPVKVSPRPPTWDVSRKIGMLLSVWKVSTRFCGRRKVAVGLAPVTKGDWLRLIIQGGGSIQTECQEACVPQAEGSHKAAGKGSAP